MARIIVCYDISNRVLRTEVACFLKARSRGRGRGAPESVFELPVDEEKSMDVEIDSVESKLKSILESKKDPGAYTVRVYPQFDVCADASSKISHTSRRWSRI